MTDNYPSKHCLKLAINPVIVNGFGSMGNPLRCSASGFDILPDMIITRIPGRSALSLLASCNPSRRGIL